MVGDTQVFFYSCPQSASRERSLSMHQDPSASGLSLSHRLSVFLFFFYIDYFESFYLFLAVLGLCGHMWAFSSCSRLGLRCSCWAWAPHCGGFSCEHGLWGACASAILVHGLRCWGMWNLPWPGIKPMSPLLAGGCLTTRPPEKSSYQFFLHGSVRASEMLIL